MDFNAGVAIPANGIDRDVNLGGIAYDGQQLAGRRAGQTYFAVNPYYGFRVYAVNRKPLRRRQPDGEWQG
jgi:hypothetical protein